MVALAHADMLAPGNEVFSRLSHFRGNDHFALAFCVLTKGDYPFDFADHSEFLRFARLEQLGHPRQSPSNIFGFGCLPGNLRHYISSLHSLAFNNVDMSSYGQEITSIQAAR